MRAFLLAVVDIHDVVRYDAYYAPNMQASLDPFGGRYLTRTARLQVREGAFPPGEVVVIEFPDLASAEAWYASPAYAALKAVREHVATTALAFFEPKLFNAQP